MSKDTHIAQVTSDSQPAQAAKGSTPHGLSARLRPPFMTAAAAQAATVEALPKGKARLIRGKDGKADELTIEVTDPAAQDASPDSAQALQLAQLNPGESAQTSRTELSDPNSLAVGALPESAIAPWLAAQGGGGLSPGLLGALALAGLGGGGGGAAAALASNPANTSPKSLTGFLASTSDSGTAGDNVTNINKPQFKGVTTARSTVTLTIDTNNDGKPDVTMTAVADDNGNWKPCRLPPCRTAYSRSM